MPIKKSYFVMTIMLILTVFPGISHSEDGIPGDIADTTGNYHDLDRTYLGAVVGVPTFLGAYLETPVAENVNLGLHAGSMLLVHSAGARMVIGPVRPGWRFRYFLGAVVVHKWYSEYADEAEGTSAHGWTGVNLTLSEGDWRLLLESGLLFGGDPQRGLGWSDVTVTWGLYLQHSI